MKRKFTGSEYRKPITEIKLHQNSMSINWVLTLCQVNGHMNNIEVTFF